MTDFGNSAAGSTLTRKLNKRRENEKQEFEAKKAEIAKQAEAGARKIDEKFAKTTMSTEAQLTQSTIGLVTIDEFRKTRAALESASAIDAASKKKKDKKAKKEKKKRKRANPSVLSFADADDFADLAGGGEDDDDVGGGDDVAGGADSRAKGKAPAEGEDGLATTTTADEETGEPPAKRKRVLKDPTVESDFLPDREKEAAEAAEKERLMQEWLDEQERIKNEVIEITYSYWDGSGHRATAHLPKGATIAKLLYACRNKFPQQLRGVPTENLMYIKEDVIIPHHYTFYDLIITKARGKSGPLFHFDVHDDIRMLSDATVEKDESHAGKIVERRWYERNKHIFPANRWEVYDPNADYGTYTIHGGEVN